MNDVTVLSYPSARERNLLSLSELRSKYMIPFAGRYRIIDFTIRNALASGASQLIVYSDVYDDMDRYVKGHPSVADGSIDVIPYVDESVDINSLYKIIKDHETPYYLIYCGDDPGLIDFSPMVENYIKKKKKKSVLYKLRSGGKASMAHTVLLTNKKNLIAVLKDARKSKTLSPNIFEMIINMLINKGIDKSEYEAVFWPLRSVTDYYNANMKLFRDRKLSHLFFKDEFLRSGIMTDQPARIAPLADVSNSFVSEGCIINGTVTDSILFPGVIIADRSVISGAILLPYVSIGKNARVDNSVIDEFTDYNNSPFLFNVNERCRVGSEEPNLRNSEYSRALFSSITLVGKNCSLPEGGAVGGACYIASASGASAFAGGRVVHDGENIETAAQNAAEQNRTQ